MHMQAASSAPPRHTCIHAYTYIHTHMHACTCRRPQALLHGARAAACAAQGDSGREWWLLTGCAGVCLHVFVCLHVLCACTCLYACTCVCMPAHVFVTMPACVCMHGHVYVCQGSRRPSSSPSSAGRECYVYVYVYDIYICVCVCAIQQRRPRVVASHSMRRHAHTGLPLPRHAHAGTHAGTHLHAHLQAHICMHVCMRIRICRCACVDALLMPNGPMANGSSDPAPFSSLLVLTSIPMADVLPESTPVSRVSKPGQ